MKKSNSLTIVRTVLKSSITLPVEKTTYFFKTGPGDYAEGDQFIGVSVPNLRKIAKDFFHIEIPTIKSLLSSKINEERQLALYILVAKYQKGSEEVKATIYDFYLKHLKHVNNWNLVDSSAHLIIGAHLLNKNKKMLFNLAKSEIMWERRIAIVATWWFIRNDELIHTFLIAKILLKDEHDLIHKATGWMLREAGKRDENTLRTFLNKYGGHMPRTMLRYAIEKFSEDERKSILKKRVW